MSNDQTHHSTLEAAVRKIANSCDLGGFNAQYFMTSSFVSDIASFIQEREAAAYSRGLNREKAFVQSVPQRLL